MVNFAYEGDFSTGPQKDQNIVHFFRSYLLCFPYFKKI